MNDALSHKASPDYRPDIDGLRALAVLSVLVYHGFPEWLTGGFVGVDVFFVISGYLISRIILTDLKRDTFRFSVFYSRRIRRIFPALLVVLIFVTILGWYVLLPGDFQMLGRHVVAGAGFASNILLFSEGGYFDVSADLKPLLHLWSLGVEEQYYLVWPLVLFAFHRHLDRIFWLIACVAIGSFILNIWGTPRYPEATFYLPVTRIWELMLGSLVAYKQVIATSAGSAGATDHRWNLPMSVAGTGLLVVSLVAIQPDDSFPGWIALGPTIGTLLLISAGPNTYINRNILSNKVMVYIGLISYPLYLWHWPLLTFARISYGGAEPPLYVRAIALISSVGLAILTYEFIEKKVRYASRTRRANLLVPGLAVSMVVVAIFGTLSLGKIAPARATFNPDLAEVSNAIEDWESFGHEGTITGSSDSAVFFFGDSHMAQYMPRVSALVNDNLKSSRTVVYNLRNGCAPFPNVSRRSRNCSESVKSGFMTARNDNVDTVVISASWIGFASRSDLYSTLDNSKDTIDPMSQDNQWVWDGLEEQIGELTTMGKQVVLLLNGPVGEAFDPRSMVKRNGLNVAFDPTPPVLRNDIVELTNPVDSRLQDIAMRTGAKLIDPALHLCSELYCPTTDVEGRPIFLDASHLRASYVRNNFEALDPYILRSTTATQQSQ